MFVFRRFVFLPVSGAEFFHFIGKMTCFFLSFGVLFSHFRNKNDGIQNETAKFMVDFIRFACYI